MLERPAAGERAIIVQLNFGRDDVSEQLEEVRLLAESAGAVVCAEVYGRRQSPDASTYAGKGKVQEVAAEVAAHAADASTVATTPEPGGGRPRAPLFRRAGARGYPARR